jgi:uncharacterized protein (TIGR00369 family)
MARDWEALIDEPVRGAIGDLRALQMSGLDSARGYVRGDLPVGPIHRLTGLRPTDAGLGKATFSMPITRWLEDPSGIIWAGAFALLADAPLGASIWTGLPPGQMVTTSELNLNFVRPFDRNTGNIVGKANSIHQGRQVGLSSVEISDRSGRLMGFGTSRCLVVDAPVDPDEQYPAPETGPSDPPDPYLREAPTNGTFDLETMLKTKPTDIQRRLIAGDVIPNVARLHAGNWKLQGEGSVGVTFPSSPWFSAGGPSLYGGVIAWMLEAATGSAVYSTLEAGDAFATLDINVRFTRPVMIGSGDVSVSATVQHYGRRVRVASAEMTTADGKRAAMATSSAMVVPGAIGQMMRGRMPGEVLESD